MGADQQAGIDPKELADTLLMIEKMAYRAVSFLDPAVSWDPVGFIEAAEWNLIRALPTFRAGEGVPLRVYAWHTIRLAIQTERAHQAREAVRLRTLPISDALDIETPPPDGEPEPSSPPLLSEGAKETVRQAIYAMPDRWQEAVCGRYWLELTWSETAREFGGTQGGMGAAHTRALRHLAVALARAFTHESVPCLNLP